MKKLCYFVAFATFGLVSCQQEQDPINDVVKNEPVIFKASIENLATRAVYDGGSLFWAEGDKIGVYADDNNYNDKNQPFTLIGSGGSKTGDFEWDNKNDVSFSSEARVAFFPWNLPADKAMSDISSYNNVWKNSSGEINMYFKLPNSYSDYTSGKMLTPLVAKLNSSSEDIQFYHAGAAVKVTISNLPAHTNYISMTADGKQIYGDYHINRNDIGANGVLVRDNATEDVTKNKVELNFTNSSAGEFTFIFPIPTVTNAKFSFEIKDVNNFPVWSGNTKSSVSYTLGHAEVLAMKPLEITTYSTFTQTTGATEGWGYVGSINSWQEFVNLPMKHDGKGHYIAKQKFAVGDKFKLRNGTGWNGLLDWYNVDQSKSKGVKNDGTDNNNIEITDADTYYIIFNSTYNDNKIVVVPTSEWTNYSSISFPATE